MDDNKNIWNEIRIESLKEFIDNISELKPNFMIFRGECDSTFELQSSLRRLMPIFNKIKNYRSSKEQLMISIEDDFVNRFECNNQLYSSSKIDYGVWTKLDKISVLQHFGAPTRLLDWSHSPYVAMYFAINDRFDNDATVYALNVNFIRNQNRDKYEKYSYDFKKNNKRRQNDILTIGKDYANEKARKEKLEQDYSEEIIIDIYEPKKNNIRIARQQGLFLVSSKIDINYEEVLNNNYNMEDGKDKNKNTVGIKFIIDKDAKLNILYDLQFMNISSEVLFPDLEGYCKGLKYKIFNSRYLERE